MEPKYTTVAELATKVQMDKSAMRRWLLRNSIPMSKQRRREHQGQPVLVVTAKDADKVVHLLTVAEGY